MNSLIFINGPKAVISLPCPWETGMLIDFTLENTRFTKIAEKRVAMLSLSVAIRNCTDARLSGTLLHLIDLRVLALSTCFLEPMMDISGIDNLKLLLFVPQSSIHGLVPHSSAKLAVLWSSLLPIFVDEDQFRNSFLDLWIPQQIMKLTSLKQELLQFLSQENETQVFKIVPDFLKVYFKLHHDDILSYK